MNSATKLSPKQARFVAEYLVDGNGARAAVAAGYGRAGSRVAAHRLLTYANVQAAIQARQGVDSQRLGLDRQAVIQGLLGAVQMARDRREPAALISAWRELGRLMGYYAPERRQVNLAAVGESKLMSNMMAMSDAELGALMAGS